MTQTLMASFENDDEPVFPAISSVLFLGGPKHGQELEVVDGDRVHRVFAVPDNPVPIMGGIGAEAHTYLRRDLSFEDADGQQYTRDVYVHESVPNPQVAQQILMATLLALFIKGGRKVIAADVPDPRSAG